MPQVLLLIAAGAGLYAGYKWLSKELQGAVAEAERMAEQANARNETTGEPKDLGALELDVSTGVYRPVPRRR